VNPAVGRILRREGIYHSQLSKWRQQRAEGINAGLSHKARGAKGPGVKTLQQENRKLQRENARRFVARCATFYPFQ
jgi:transposase-like protein